MKKISEIWHYRYYVGSRILESLGVLMLLYELLIIVAPIEDFIPGHKVCLFTGIVLLCLFYSIYGLLFPQKELSLNINKRTRLVIRQGDLMTSDGLLVIPVNEYFDTHLGDGIINKNSLHGKLLTRYDGKIPDLRKKIDKELATLTPLPVNRRRVMVAGLPNRRYPLGTCVRIVDGNSCFLLVATTRFNENEHVDVSTEEFPEIIRKMFNGIEQLYDGRPVYLPLVGSGISGYELTNMQIMYIIVQAADMANRLSLTNGLHLYVFSDEQMKSINLNVIKYLYHRWKTLK